MNHIDRYRSLPEVSSIDDIEVMEGLYKERFGIAPFNVSHWDPSEEFKNRILSCLELPPISSVIDYTFSYTVEHGMQVLEKLGGVATKHRYLFTPSGTASILSLVNWLCARGVNKVYVLCPAYFALFHACRRFGIRAEKRYLRRGPDGFQLPPLRWTGADGRAALWITNPIYCTSVYLSRTAIEYFKKLLEDGWIIMADECLALPGRELLRELGGFQDFLTLYAPHKAICVNGVKFSVVVFDRSHEDFFDQWSDVISGGLGCSTSMAIKHYTTANFNRYSSRFLGELNTNQVALRKLCKGTNVVLDEDVQGHFLTCYFPTLSCKVGTSSRILEDLVNSTGGSIIPGNRYHFNPRFGMTFRVNLARSGPSFLPTTKRIFSYLSALCSPS